MERKHIQIFLDSNSTKKSFYFFAQEKFRASQNGKMLEIENFTENSGKILYFFMDSVRDLLNFDL